MTNPGKHMVDAGVVLERPRQAELIIGYFVRRAGFRRRKNDRHSRTKLIFVEVPDDRPVATHGVKATWQNNRIKWRLSPA
jgi:hypothetical protein